MISTYKDILKKVDVLNSTFDESAQIQKIYSSSYYISVQIRIPSKSHYLIIGRGHNNEGLWLSDTQIPSVIRKKDRFLEYMRKHIAGCRFISSKMDTNDRAFCISFGKWRRECEIYFFYSARDLYFQTKIWSNKTNSYEYFQSWRGKVDLETMNFANFDEVGRRDISDKETCANELSAEKLLKQETESALSKGTTPKSIKFLKRKLKNIENDLKVVKNYKQLETKIDELDFESLEKKTKLFDIKMKFTTDSQYARRDEAFKKIKKLKKAEEILTLRLSDTESKLLKVNKDFEKIDNKLKVTEPIWKVQKKEKSVIVEQEYIIKSVENINLGIGKSSRGNDQLRSHFAHKDDWWFHLSDRPSSHIIAKNVIGITPEVLDIIGAEFCAMEKTSEVDLVYTQVKNLKAVKGKSGLVRYKKEKYLRFSL